MSGVNPNIIAGADEETICTLLNMIEQCELNPSYELEARLGHLNDNNVQVKIVKIRNIIDDIYHLLIKYKTFVIFFYFPIIKSRIISNFNIIFLATK